MAKESEWAKRDALARLIQDVLDDGEETPEFIAISPELDEVCIYESISEVPDGWAIEYPSHWPWPAYDIADMYFDLR